jgi:hypothetical protein
MSQEEDWYRVTVGMPYADRGFNAEFISDDRFTRLADAADLIKVLEETLPPESGLVFRVEQRCSDPDVWVILKDDSWRTW